MSNPHDPTTPTVGYLRKSPHAAAWDLLVPCPSCDYWHTHGAGNAAEPFYAPGDTTERVPHCGDRQAYGWIVIAAEPFRAGWMTPRRRKSKQWHTHAAAARERDWRRNRQMNAQWMTTTETP